MISPALEKEVMEVFSEQTDDDARLQDFEALRCVEKIRRLREMCPEGRLHEALNSLCCQARDLVRPSWSEIKLIYVEAISYFVEFSARTSRIGGIDIVMDSHTIHIPEHSSVQHPLVQMMLFAHKFNGAFVYPKSMLPESIFAVAKILHPTALPYLFGAGWIFAIHSSESTVARPHSDFYPRESIGWGNEPSMLLVSTKDETSSTPRSGDNCLLLSSGAYRSATTDAEGNRVSKNILMLSRAGNQGSSSEGTCSMSTGDDDRRGTDLAYLKVLLDSQAHVTVTGNCGVYSSLTILQDGFDLVGFNGDSEPTLISGNVCFGRFMLNNVHYSPRVGNRIIISGSELDKLGYSYECGRGKCSITDLRTRFPWTRKIVGEGCLIDGDYVLDYLKIPKDRTLASVPSELEEPALVTSLWKALCSVWHGFTFTGPLFQRASTKTSRRPLI